LPDDPLIEAGAAVGFSDDQVFSIGFRAH
jgi:hypothetical protein